MSPPPLTRPSELPAAAEDDESASAPDESPATLVGLFDAAVARGADRISVIADGAALSYRQLDEWADGISQELRARGVTAGHRVALRMDPGAAAVAAMLGILKAGACYVPLDVRNPRARNEFILADSGAAVLVGDPGGLGTGDGGQGGAPAGPRVIGGELLAALRGRPAPPAAPGPDPGDTAYVIYTSGTTGKPKGVPVRHGSAVALLASSSRLFAFTAEDRWLLFHSIAFDFSVWEIWGALSTGAGLVVLPPYAARTPDQVLAVVADHGITVLNQTPTAFSALTDAVLKGERDLPGLRYVIFGGEKLAPAALRPWVKRFGTERPRLVNMYGITETTVHATHHEIGEADLTGDDSVIGPPLPGFRARVVGADGRDVPVGEPGELWLSGPQVTHGYLNRPELNAERFPTASGDGPEPGTAHRYYRSGDLVSARPNGDLVYHGRADLQVKLRGHRIELSDIESAVRGHESVADAVVWVREFKAGDSRLVCAVVPREGAGVRTRDLRTYIKAKLPSYMQPARYRLLTELPRTVNGKTDRAAVARTWEEMD
ncbi:amino acid adenylation domain-containing protein [Streptomyces sp. NPDC051162]|uniref:amino acid adenylation domain-containing protein n=1 Tax=Streptomyces sp. NPDC051162 TaxID=3154747 RepID=UPI0034178EC7